MPSIICPSPQILDQSFPRDADELNIIASALGKLVELSLEKRLKVLQTEQFESLIDAEFIWAEKKNLDAEQTSLLYDITRQFAQLYLNSAENIEYIDINVTEYISHPLPEKCHGEMVNLLADELGRILIIHDQCIAKDEYFIGIACPYGFSGDEVDTYQSPTTARYFPLVGEKTFETMLSDAYEWYIPSKTDIENRNVARDDLERNYAIIGISDIDSVRGRGSHQLLVIEGKRSISWPQPQRKGEKDVQKYILDELSEALNYPINVIKYALREGKLPERRCKLDRLKPQR